MPQPHSGIRVQIPLDDCQNERPAPPPLDKALARRLRGERWRDIFATSVAAAQAMLATAPGPALADLPTPRTIEDASCDLCGQTISTEETMKHEIEHA